MHLALPRLLLTTQGLKVLSLLTDWAQISTSHLTSRSCKMSGFSAWENMDLDALPKHWRETCKDKSVQHRNHETNHSQPAKEADKGFTSNLYKFRKSVANYALPSHVAHQWNFMKPRWCWKYKELPTACFAPRRCQFFWDLNKKGITSLLNKEVYHGTAHISCRWLGSSLLWSIELL